MLNEKNFSLETQTNTNSGGTGNIQTKLLLRKPYPNTAQMSLAESKAMTEEQWKESEFILLFFFRSFIFPTNPIPLCTHYVICL